MKKTLIYTALIIWTVIALFPIFWTFSTTFKVAKDVQTGQIIPWLQFSPSWLGMRAIGLSPDTIFNDSTPREEFVKRFWNSIQASLGGASVALVIGSMAAYGLSRFQYKWAIWKNRDISFFFLSQLILPPVVLAMPFLVLYKELEQAALVDGCSSWGAFIKIILPIALPGMVAAFILAVILCWNEYFFAALLTSTHAKTLPVMVASQTGSQGISWWSMAAVSSAAILPLIIIGIFLERFIVKGLTAGAVK
jgi:multiple sugar transport system permease protein